MIPLNFGLIRGAGVHPVFFDLLSTSFWLIPIGAYADLVPKMIANRKCVLFSHHPLPVDSEVTCPIFTISTHRKVRPTLN